MSISELEREQGLVCDYVRHKGLVMANSDDCQRQFCELYENVLKPVFLSEIVEVHLRSVFTYQQSGQKVEEFRRSDGEAFRLTSPDGKKDIGAIGLAEEVFGRGNEYIAFLFLHELAHLYLWGENHTEKFHSVLDGFLIRCNAVTGWKLKNDYFGLDAPPKAHSNNDDDTDAVRRPVSGSTNPRDLRPTQSTTEHVKEHERTTCTGGTVTVQEHDRKKPMYKLQNAKSTILTRIEKENRTRPDPIPEEWAKVIARCRMRLAAKKVTSATQQARREDSIEAPAEWSKVWER